MNRHQNRVFSTAMRLVANSAEAEDIAQEVFLKAYERFAELSQSPTVRWWLKRVATNLSLNYLSRYRARWSFFSELFRGEEGDGKTEADFAAPGDLSDAVAVADRHRQVSSTPCGTSPPPSAYPSFCSTWKGSVTKRSRPN